MMKDTMKLHIPIYFTYSEAYSWLRDGVLGSKLAFEDHTSKCGGNFPQPSI